MTRKTLWLAAGIVVLTNAIALRAAWVNRSGEPDAELVLTEREVRLLPYETENTALGLRLAWIDPARGAAAPGWFDAAALGRLGFDCTAPMTEQNSRSYRSQPPRAAFAAFEFEGESWQRYLDSLQDEAARESAVRGFPPRARRRGPRRRRPARSASRPPSRDRRTRNDWPAGAHHAVDSPVSRRPCEHRLPGGHQRSPGTPRPPRSAGPRVASAHRRARVCADRPARRRTTIPRHHQVGPPTRTVAGVGAANADQCQRKEFSRSVLAVTPPNTLATIEFSQSGHF